METVNFRGIANAFCVRVCVFGDGMAWYSVSRWPWEKYIFFSRWNRLLLNCKFSVAQRSEADDGQMANAYKTIYTLRTRLLRTKRIHYFWFISRANETFKCVTIHCTPHTHGQRTHPNLSASKREFISFARNILTHVDTSRPRIAENMTQKRATHIPGLIGIDQNCVIPSVDFRVRPDHTASFLANIATSNIIWFNWWWLLWPQF